ncbi:MAG: DDE-type integrase/transposase/recombinase [SAR324 cluster bacterium]|nr:DDE-type integrase/transposase/recombinase [SAR324 cluster bacterium]
MLDRHFNPEKPSQVWASDINCLWTSEWWVYLAAVIDLYSQRVVGWSVDSRRTTELVENALKMAVQRRKPAPGILFPSNRESQFTTIPFHSWISQPF